MTNTKKQFEGVLIIDDPVNKAHVEIEYDTDERADIIYLFKNISVSRKIDKDIKPINIQSRISDE